MLMFSALFLNKKLKYHDIYENIENSVLFVHKFGISFI